MISNKAQNGVASIAVPVRKPNDEKKIDETPEESQKMEEENLEKLQEEVKFIEEESFGRGLFGALKNIREKGYIMEDSLEVSGRSKDKTYGEELAKFKQARSDKIKLEYRDETGRLMTPKEAFRYQCWIFHGKKPGKNKIERKRKKYEATIKQKSMTTAQLPTMKALARAQKDTHQPYLILNSTKK